MDSNKLEIINTSESFDSWLSKPYISAELRQKLETANFLIVPEENFRDSSRNVFPTGTNEVFQFLKEHGTPELKVDICMSDEEYVELARHGALMIIGQFVVTNIIAPLGIDLIAEYLKGKLGIQFGKEDSKIKVELTIVDGTKAAQIKYEGAAKDFATVVKGSLPSFDQLPEAKHANK